jgi:hypothetical protein
MQTGASAGQVPQPTEPPQPSSIAPHCTPAPMHVAQVVVVVELLDVVVTLLAGAVLDGTSVVEVLGVTTGVAPQPGGVGSTLDLQVLISALRLRAHATRHGRPAFPLAQAVLHAFSCVTSNTLQSFGHRAASTEGIRSKATRSAITKRMRETSDAPAIPGDRL